MIFWLRGAPEECWFPDPAGALGEPNGLLAAGGDLSPERLLEAYRRGIFPWYESGQPILWWSPDPRAVLWPEDLHVSRRLARRLRSDAFRVSMDQDFEAVIRGCADRGPDVGTWITPAMERAYDRLHVLGHAHSVEVWQEKALAGGLYGVAMGRVFFAESMFSAATDASKVALACLTRLLQRHGFRLIDCQMATPHLIRLGCREMPRSEFLECIERWCREPAGAVGWQRPPMHPMRYMEGADRD